jgi:hypothetical protein
MTAIRNPFFEAGNSGPYATVDFGDCNPGGGCDMRGPGIRNIHEGMHS